MYSERLETFICVAECCSFSKAAEKLYLSTNAVMKRINLLESQLNLVLFERSAQGLILTPAGESFYNSAGKLVQQMKDAVERARVIENEKANTIWIGNISQMPEEILDKFWPALRMYCSDLVLRYVNFRADKDDILRMINSAGTELDVVLDYFDEEYIQSIGYHSVKIADIPVKLIVPLCHRLAHKKVIRREDLRGETILLPEHERAVYWTQIYEDLKERTDLEISIEEYDPWDLDIFNRCERKKQLLINSNIMFSINPFLKTIPVDWNYSIPFGIYYQKEAKGKTKRFVEAIKLAALKESETVLQ